MIPLASSFGNGDVFLWMLEFFLFVIWFWLLLTIFSDLFRDHETSGGMKAVWIIVLILLPYLGILIYLIARGHGMAGRAAKQQARDAGADGQPHPARPLVRRRPPLPTRSPRPSRCSTPARSTRRSSTRLKASALGS